jgi:hypothetical protein
VGAPSKFLVLSAATMDGQKHKAHRAPQSGGKVEKKKGAEKHAKGFNEKVCYNAVLFPSSKC